MNVMWMKGQRPAWLDALIAAAVGLIGQTIVVRLFSTASGSLRSITLLRQVNEHLQMYGPFSPGQAGGADGTASRTPSDLLRVTPRWRALAALKAGLIAESDALIHHVERGGAVLSHGSRDGHRR